MPITIRQWIVIITCYVIALTDKENAHVYLAASLVILSMDTKHD